MRAGAVELGVGEVIRRLLNDLARQVQCLGRPRLIGGEVDREQAGVGEALGPGVDGIGQAVPLANILE